MFYVLCLSSFKSNLFSLQHIKKTFVFLDDGNELVLRHETIRVLVQFVEQLLRLAKVTVRSQHLIDSTDNPSNIIFLVCFYTDIQSEQITPVIGNIIILLTVGNCRMPWKKQKCYMDIQTRLSGEKAR